MCFSVYMLGHAQLNGCPSPASSAAAFPSMSTPPSKVTIQKSDSDDWSQMEYDSPTTYQHWCESFRNLGWPYPEKLNPPSPTPHTDVPSQAGSPEVDHFKTTSRTPDSDFQLKTTTYCLPMPVCAFIEMPSQATESQSYEFESPTQQNRQPRLGVLPLHMSTRGHCKTQRATVFVSPSPMAQKQFYNILKETLTVPNSEEEELN